MNINAVLCVEEAAWGYLVWPDVPQLCPRCFRYSSACYHNTSQLNRMHKMSVCEGQGWLQTLLTDIHWQSSRWLAPLRWLTRL